MRTRSLPRPLRYHLRFQLLPGRRLNRDTRELISFCRAHRVEEVVLFVAAEEWNNGLLSRAEEDRWFRAIRQAKTALDRAGLGVSLNPWMTTLHADRGRTFPKGRRFAPMVSPRGVVSTACASFADPAWQRYLARLYGRFARLGFRVIWIEDDFRYHNHAPLDWGGGFEAPVLERFGRKLGRRVTRAQVVAALLKPGRPHPWRARWQETWRELQLEVARQLAAAVGAAAGGRTQLGLMSSDPRSHSVEGRDWPALFQALAIDGRVAHRPHYAPYAEAPGLTKTYGIQTLDLQKSFRPAECEVAPEVENFPFTRWTKSDTQTWAEMALALFHGSDALLLDLFPFSANAASAEPAIGELLDAAQPALSWIAARFPARLLSQGVGVPYRPDAAAHLRLAAGADSLWVLSNASPYGAGQFLLQYGIPITANAAPVNAVFGSLMWAFSDAEIREWLRHGLLLDAVSAAILNERGFGADTGVSVAGVVGREAAPYAVEEVVSAATGVRPGHYFNANLVPAMGRLRARPGAEVWTRILRADGSVFGDGWVVYRNKLGGVVATSATPEPAQLAVCDQRRDIAQRLVRALAGDRFASPLVRGGPHLLPMHFRQGERQVLVVFNGQTDPVAPVIDWPGHDAGRSWVLAPLCAPVPARRGARVPYQGFLVTEW